MLTEDDEKEDIVVFVPKGKNAESYKDIAKEEIDSLTQNAEDVYKRQCRRSMVQLHQEEAATRTRKLKVQNADPLRFALSHFHDNLRQ